MYKRVLNSIKGSREAEIQVKILYLYTSIRMGIIRDIDNNFWEGCIEVELSYAAYEHVKSIST